MADIVKSGTTLIRLSKLLEILMYVSTDSVTLNG